MKTNINTSIRTQKQAKKFLKELYLNNESFHPEDDAHDIIFSHIKVSQEDRDTLNKRMEDIYDIGGFDPCEYLLDLINT